MTLMTIFVGIIALSNLVLLFAIAFLIVSIKRLVDTGMLPAMSEVKATIKNVNRLVDRVEDKAERIMDISEETARKISGTVVATTDMVGQGVSSPLIEWSSLIAGVSKALQTWRSASARS